MKWLFSSYCIFVVINSLFMTTCYGSLSDVTDDLFGGRNDGVVAAFGDFNGDKLTDIFVLSDGGKVLHLLQSVNDVTKKRSSFFRKILIGNKQSEGSYISSLAPGDFDGDAQMDLLVTRKKDGDGKSAPVTIQIYWGNAITDNLGGNHIAKSDTGSSLELNVTLRDQPSIVDINGDMIPDLLGEDSSDGSRSYFIFRRNRTYVEEKVKNGTSTDALDPLRIPQSSAFFDFDGDLVPDLCMVSEKNNGLQFEIWLNKNGLLTWNRTIPSPPEMKQFGRASFYDLNDNQEINIILPGCLNGNGDCTQSVVYVWGRDQWHDLHINLKAGSDESWYFSTSSMPEPWLDVPMMLRIGDFNLDGFPDALTVLKSSSNDSYATFLMMNVASSGNFTRTFHTDLGHPVSAVSKQPPLAAFCDFLENGILDILLTEYKKDAPVLRALEQEFTADAYFLKVMVASGLCMDDCPNDHEPYGVNQVGPVIRFRTTTSTGELEIGVASQLSQSAYFSLQLPFEVFGLGQTPNFVDVLEVGVQNPANTNKRQRSWPSIIPNAQVVVIPYPLDTPSRWHTKLYVTPSRLVLLTGASLLGTCAVIGVIIGLLHWRERVEDKKEKLQEAQRFHFDAM